VCESELARLREATSPVIAASGGFIVPAAIYVPLNRGDADALHGGHPRATDIGFAIGVCALLGRAVPRAVAFEDEAPLTQIRLVVLLALLLAGAVAALVLRLAAPAKC
jgi:NhaA family Na+:H+ antiporter